VCNDIRLVGVCAGAQGRAASLQRHLPAGGFPALAAWCLRNGEDNFPFDASAVGVWNSMGFTYHIHFGDPASAVESGYGSVALNNERLGAQRAQQAQQRCKLP